MAWCFRISSLLPGCTQGLYITPTTSIENVYYSPLFAMNLHRTGIGKWECTPGTSLGNCYSYSVIFRIIPDMHALTLKCKNRLQENTALKSPVTEEMNSPTDKNIMVVQKAASISCPYPSSSSHHHHHHHQKQVWHPKHPPQLAPHHHHCPALTALQEQQQSLKPW